MAINVHVPYNKKIRYTLFAKGNILDFQFTENEDFITYQFDENSVLCLFYTFTTPCGKYRRAYIVSKAGKNDDFCFLPGVTEPLLIIYTAIGRKIDYFKRSLKFLFDIDGKKIFYFPIAFWYRFAGLCQFFKAQKSDVLTLYREFNHKRRKN